MVDTALPQGRLIGKIRAFVKAHLKLASARPGKEILG